MRDLSAFELAEVPRIVVHLLAQRLHFVREQFIQAWIVETTDHLRVGSRTRLTGDEEQQAIVQQAVFAKNPVLKHPSHEF